VATPTTRSLELPAPAGATVSVQVTSAGGWRPVVVVSGGPGARAPFVERLVYAGFATVVCDAQSPEELTIVLDALDRGDLGVDAASYIVLECAADGSLALAEVHPGTRAAGRPVRPIPWLGVESWFEEFCKRLHKELS